MTAGLRGRAPAPAKLRRTGAGDQFKIRRIGWAGMLVCSSELAALGGTILGRSGIRDRAAPGRKAERVK
jgi:hypothetical protein